MQDLKLGCTSSNGNGNGPEQKLQLNETRKFERDKPVYVGVPNPSQEVMLLCSLVPRRLCKLNQLLSNARVMSSLASGKKSLPDGVWPTMITPFLNDSSKSVDWQALDCKERTLT